MAKSKRAEFITMVETLIDGRSELKDEFPNGIAFWEGFIAEQSTTKITEKGQMILDYLQDHTDTWLTASEIGIGVGMAPKSVSGSMTKLFNEHYVEKTKGENGVAYRLTV